MQLTGSQGGVVVAVLVAAVLHASWNALLKDGQDRLVMVVLLDLTAMVLAATGISAGIVLLNLPR